MAKKRQPTIVVDEHVHPDLKEAFAEQGLRTISAARDRRYAGRDEREFIEEMYAANEIFVTSDLEFMGWVLENRPKHAGIVYLPIADTDFRVGFAVVTAGWILGSVADAGPFAMRRLLVYADDDGLHELDQFTGDERRAISWEEVLEE